MRNPDREAVWMKRVASLGEFVEAIGNGAGVKGVEGGRVTSVLIRMPTKDKPEALLVVKASGEGGDKVGFVGALDVGTAFLTWRAKERGQGLKWREDVPWTSAKRS